MATLALLAIALAVILPGLRELEHDDDVLAFLPPEHPDVVAFREVADRFGMLEVALVGLRYEDGQTLLTKERTDEARTVANAVRETPGVQLVLSYPDLPDAKVRGETLVVAPLVPEDLPDEQIPARVLGNGNAVGNLISKEGTDAALLVYMLPGADPSQRAEYLLAIRAAVAETWGGEAFFGGAPFIEHEAASSSRADIDRLSPIVVLVLALASALLLRSIAGAVLNLLITGLGVGLVVGAHGFFGEPLTIVSGTIPVMMVALGGAFGMHVIAGFMRQTGTNRERASAVVRELWLPVVLSGVTTATAFFALVVMPQQPMKRFGVAAGIGVLLLLALALFVLPVILGLLPRGVLKHREARPLPFRFIPPLWALGLFAVAGIGLATQLEADPDTRNVFDEHSEVRRADTFFNEGFGGSQFVQIAIEGDLREPTVLRAIRDMTEAMAQIDGVADVRSLIEPVVLLTEGFGGRDGLPKNPDQARSVVANLADQSVMAQLMTEDGMGAIIHVKLAPLPGDELLAATAAIRSVADARGEGPIRVAATSVPEVAQSRIASLSGRATRLLGQEITAEQLQRTIEGVADDEALLPEAKRLRDRAFGGDELIEPLPAAAYAEISAAELLKLRGAELEALIRQRVPTLVENDPKGIAVIAEQLGGWLDDAQDRLRVDGICESLELPREDPSGPPPQEKTDDLGLGFEDDTPPKPAGPCGVMAGILSELGDAEWEAPLGADVAVSRELPFAVRITGQPIIGQAFAQSVTWSLRWSTLVSLAALSVVLLVSRSLRALLPAVWTLAVTAGLIFLLGHPISIGTSMVSCIALGAGVDFAIHLGVRARRAPGPNPGRVATDEIGGVILVTGVQLALAFMVLLASAMPPLRQFGVGLAIGLLGAAAGAVWLTAQLHRR